MSIDNLKATVSGRNGLARTNRFKIVMFPPVEAFNSANDIRDLSILCDSTSMPGRQIGTADHSYYRQSMKVANSYINEDVEFTFNLTNDFFIKDIFSKWTNLIINRDTYKLNYASVYKRDVAIYQQDIQDQTIYAIKLINAFPITVTAQTLDSSDAQIQQLSVSFTYEDFEELIVPQPAAPIQNISTLGATDLPRNNPNFA